jgi:pyruvate kinase
MTPLPAHKTKIVCTVGPASSSVEMLEKMIRAGMSIARLNFSHGDFEVHRQFVAAVREAGRRAGRRVAILADLPGPKMRVGTFEKEPVLLEPGAPFTLTPDPVAGTAEQVSVTFEPLPEVVKPGDALFLNDGFIQLEVTAVEGRRVRCRVIVGGELRSRKGLNLPGIDLGLSAFTERDHACLKAALAMGVDAVSQSFVETPLDLVAVRNAAADLGHHPFLVAKIERAGALDHLGGILQACDGVMGARGDLGVEVPIERMAVVQKELIRRANAAGRPVITATHMLESMTEHRRPTRAEATDVANAVLDGTDAVMLSGESAMGKFPVESTAMLAGIAAATEPHRSPPPEVAGPDPEGSHPVGLIAHAVRHTLERVDPAAIIVPTHSGFTARNIARHRPRAWILGVSSREDTCQHLLFSSGVWPLLEPDHPSDWRAWARRTLAELDLPGPLALLTEGPSSAHPDGNNRLEFLDLGSGGPRPTGAIFSRPG